MNLIDYLDPVSLEKPPEHLISGSNIFGKNIDIHTPDFQTWDINKYDLVILGVPEDRNSLNKGSSLAPEKIRAQLYQLNRHEKAIRILDLGNIKQGNTFTDTYVALKEVIEVLLLNNLIICIIGGTQELTLSAFQAYEAIKTNINLVTIDRTIDLIKESVKTNAESYLSEILLKKRRLFKYCNLGHQVYLTDKHNIDLINKLYHDAFRIGEVRADISIVEPYVRDTDMVSFDISAVRQSDAPAFFNPSPSGFTSEEACQLARYSGISDMVSLFGLFEVNPKFDNRLQTSNLAAQIIWYFIDGLTYRNVEIPSGENKNFKAFIVGNTDVFQEITFYKSLISERWWMEVPNPKNNKSVIISCSYSDYLAACEQEVPTLWWKAFQKLA
jgi:arginase family enzyme